MIKRTLEPVLKERAEKYPVVTLLGPRQSGKTTLCRAVFPEKPYVSLEPLDEREHARSDPRGFLSRFPDGAILDEIQNVPDLFHYLQDIVDQKNQSGMFILTGSQNFLLSEKISQSLAGRTAILTLLPLTHAELVGGSITSNVWESVWQGGYPRIYDQQIPADEWLADYTFTYLQKDVRQILNIGDVDAFSRFLRLSAARTAQEVNFSTLSGDTGVSHNTLKNWYSVLYESYIATAVPAWFPNIRKRIVKSPKLHFLDTGLACYLLGIRSPEQLRLHPLRGALFETWVTSEIYKSFLNRGKAPRVFHYRETGGLEFDLLIESIEGLCPVEVKSAETVSSNFFRSFGALSAREGFFGSASKGQDMVVYAGETSQERSGVTVVPWRDVSGLGE